MGKQDDPTATDGLNSLAKSYNAKLNTVTTRAVVIQLGLMLLLSFVTILAFSLLRPRHKVIYMPRYKYSADSKRPPRIDDGLFSWLRPLTQISQNELVDQIGLDAVVFLLFLRMARWMCTAVAALACGVLIPVNLVYNLRTASKLRRTFFAEISITNVEGNSLYVHVTVSYLICFIVYYFVYRYYTIVVELRWQWFRSKEYQDALYARSLLLTRVHKKGQSDPGLQALLDSLKMPYPITACHIGRRTAELPALIERHNETVCALETVLTTYLHKGKIAHKRPTLRLGGFTCFGGRKVDAIDYYTEKIKKLETRIDLTRESISDRKAENYGFASFESAPAAHIVAQRLAGKRIKGVVMELAPPPSEIVWENLAKSDSTIRRQQFFASVIVVVVATVWIIPLVAVSLLANLASVTQYVDFLDNWSNKSSFTFSAVVGVAPPVLSTLLQLALPPIFRSLTRFGGATTRGKMDRAVLARYFLFLFVTQFIIFSLLGVLFTTIADVVVEVGKNESFERIIHNLRNLPLKIQSTYISQSNYWLTWYPTRGLSAAFDLAQMVSLVVTSLRTKLWGRTPREIREWTKPPEFDFASYFANMLIMLLIALTYAPLAPLVPLLAAAAFFASSWIYKYQLMYICVTRCESGGRLWRLVINRLLFSTMVMNALMCLTIGLQQGWIYSISTLPPIIMTGLFKLYLKRTFDHRFTWFIPAQNELQHIRAHKADASKNRLVKRFGHPSLHAELFRPMVHQASAHLLPEIYKGRLDPSDNLVTGPSRPGQQAGGLNFAAVAQHDLLYSQAQYLRERDDDEMSLASTAMLKSSTVSRPTDFSVSHNSYLQHGPQPAGTREVLSGSRDNIEMGRMPTNYSLDSQENLLGSHHMSRGAHGQTPSTSSMDLSFTGDPRSHSAHSSQGGNWNPSPQHSNYGVALPAQNQQMYPGGQPTPPSNQYHDPYYGYR